MRKSNVTDAPNDSNNQDQDDVGWLNEPPTVLQIVLAMGGFVVVMVLAAAVAVVVNFLTRAGGLTR